MVGRVNRFRGLSVVGPTLLLLVFTLPRSVRADPSHDQRDGVGVQVGTVVGFSELAGVELITIGGHLSTRKRVGQFSLAAEYDFTKLRGETTHLVTRRGTYDRLGLSGRLELGRLARRFSGDDTLLVFWTEAGVGRQWIGWETGERLRRSDVAVGAGWVLDHRLRPLRSGKPAYIGWHFGWRLTASESPRQLPASLAACRTPRACPPSTASREIDLGLLVNSSMTVSW